MNLSTTIQKKLEEGKHTVVFKDYENIDNEKGGYIKINLAFKDRETSEVIFPKSAAYFFSCMRNQLGLEDEDVTYGEILEQLKGKNIDVYVSYNSYGRNISYHEAVQPAEKVDAESINI